MSRRRPTPESAMSAAEVAARASGRRFVPASRLAKEIGVGVDLLQGLIESRSIDGFVSSKPKGGRVYFIYSDQAEALREMTSGS